MNIGIPCFVKSSFAASSHKEEIVALAIEFSGNKGLTDRHVKEKHGKIILASLHISYVSTPKTSYANLEINTDCTAILFCAACDSLKRII